MEVVKYLKDQLWWHKMGDDNRSRQKSLEKAWVVVSSHTIRDMKIVLNGPSIELDDSDAEISLKACSLTLLTAPNPGREGGTPP